MAYSLYDFQEDALTHLLNGKHALIMGTGLGKTAVAMRWAEEKCKLTGKNKVLVVTTASKTKAKNTLGENDFEADAKMFCSKDFASGLKKNMELLSWHKLAKWVDAHWDALDEHIVIYDELQYAKAGVSSGRGKAFLKIAKNNNNWIGLTATPGDTWLSFYAYFQACGLVKNKTAFLNEFASIQTYKGYPEIVGWRHEDELEDMWAEISYAPDTAKMMSELPEQTHKVFIFKKPSKYDKIFKTRYTEDGTFLDTQGALCAELRRQCFTKDKQEWVKDFVDSLGSGCVFFYNFIKTGDMLEEIMKKALPKDAKIWRIDGKHHEIPTAETIGKKDMVLCQWQSGSEGLNLHFLHYMAIVEANYSYSLSIQGRGRIRRIGQKMPQFYYYLKTEGTIEDAIYEALRTKSDFAEDTWCLREGVTDGED